MDFLKLYDKNKHLLLEQEGAADTGGVEGFVGTRGQDVDDVYAGPYHPLFGKIKELLQYQLDRKVVMRKWNDEITPLLQKFFKYLDIDYKFDSLSSKDDIEKMQKFINDSETKWKYLDVDMKYDKIQHTDNTHFINQSNDWKYIYDSNKTTGENNV